MKKNALLVVQADNLYATNRAYTPLVRDMSIAVSKSFKPEAEIIVRWSPAKQGYTHTHCLVFKKT